METIKYKVNEYKAYLQELLKKPGNAELLDKWLKSELAYTSNAIEGNTLTRKETELVIEEHITSSSKPFVFYQEAVNHAKAFERVLEVLQNNLPVNENEVLNLHKLILAGIDDTNAGFYRSCMVRIAGSRVVLPNPIKVPELMKDFFQWLETTAQDDFMAAIEVHFRLVSIHPFTDGNGRTARLLMNLFLIKAGYSPLIIRPADRKRYLNNLEKSQLTGDIGAHNKFMLNILARSLEIAINIIDVNEKAVDKLLTISKFAKLSGVPVSTIRYWVQTGKLKPVSYTDSGYMLFSPEQNLTGVNQARP